MGIKGYLDKVEATQEDLKVIEDPESIATTYLFTTEMLARNLKVRCSPNLSTHKRQEVKNAKSSFLAQLKDESRDAADRIVGWCNGEEGVEFPVAAVEYKGFEIEGKDILDAAQETDDVRTNFKIQEQATGTFIVAYSDERLKDKMTYQDEEPTNRVYLNPRILDAPVLFEQLLQAANQAGLSIQLKMYQRAAELGMQHVRVSRGEEVGGLRGDGIVMYASEQDANAVLDLALSIAKDNSGSFVGRTTSRMPQRVADGIAVGDEPAQRGTSLTTHRERILSAAAKKARESGQQGEEARRIFRKWVDLISKANNVNPENLAFNAYIN